MAKQITEASNLVTYFAFAVLLLAVSVVYLVPGEVDPLFRGPIAREQRLAAAISDGEGLRDFCLDACTPADKHRHTCATLCNIPNAIIDNIDIPYVVGATVQASRTEVRFSFLYLGVESDAGVAVLRNPYRIFDYLPNASTSGRITGAATLNLQGSGYCGDGFCDYYTEDTNNCPSDCVSSAYCGDGNTDENEECDDANSINTDECLNTCKNARCGDGFVQAGVEECDDGNSVNTDSCLNTCEIAKCNDGFIHAGVETCDPPGSTCNLPGVVSPVFFGDCNNVCQCQLPEIEPIGPMLDWESSCVALSFGARPFEGQEFLRYVPWGKQFAEVQNFLSSQSIELGYPSCEEVTDPVVFPGGEERPSMILLSGFFTLSF
jgi:cysteine-rich repeat protein